MILDQIIILGLGASNCEAPDTLPFRTEIWGIGPAYKAHLVTHTFELHDRVLLKRLNPNFVEQANKRGFHVISKDPFLEIKNNSIFPIQNVINEFQIEFFLNSICYMIAYAIMQEPKSISLMGVDMRNNMDFLVEKGCVEFWCGVAVGRGIKVFTPKLSNVLRNNFKDRNQMYSYGKGVDYEIFTT